jgi:hypothetical protein
MKIESKSLYPAVGGLILGTLLAIDETSTGEAQLEPWAMNLPILLFPWPLIGSQLHLARR